jgi:hypothetical protein
MVRDADFSKLPAIAQAVKAANTWVCPTMVVTDLPRTDSTWLEEASYVPPAVFARYRTMYPNKNHGPAEHATRARSGHGDAYSSPQGRRSFAARHRHSQARHPAGFFPPRELENFVAAGMTPYEAIRAGTADAAEFLNQGKEFGVVVVGRRADGAVGLSFVIPSDGLNCSDRRCPSRLKLRIQYHSAPQDGCLMFASA